MDAVYQPDLQEDRNDDRGTAMDRAFSPWSLLMGVLGRWPRLVSGRAVGAEMQELSGKALLLLSWHSSRDKAPAVSR